MKLLLIVAVVIAGGFAVWMFSSMNQETPQQPAATTKEAAPEIKMADKTTEKKVVETKPQTIVDVAIANGNFTTLVKAVQAAGLVETLSGTGPFTVFAPTDAAFAKLPAGTVESLLKDTEKLKAILTYHVVSGKVMSSDVVKLTSAKTVNGQSVTIDAKSGVKVNNATVVTADVPASNGVIHVIDTVLLPK